MKLERKIPLTLVATLIAQTGAGLMWAGAADARLGEVERRIAASAGAAERLARVEEQIGAVRETLKRMEGKLDALGKD